MPSSLKRFLFCLTVLTLAHGAGENHKRAVAVVLPPETVSPEQSTSPSEMAPEEVDSQSENPYEQSGNTDPYEQTRRKRETTAILIILGVVLLISAYWWTSGKLHHRIPE